MHRTRPALAALAGGALVLAACGGDDDAVQEPAAVTADPMPAATASTGSTTGDTMTEQTTSAQTTTEPTMGGGTTVAAEPVAAEPEPAALAAWQTMPITDTAGLTFTLADYLGRPLLVETFATWCSSCRAQLGDTQQAAAALGDEAGVVALSVETDLAASDVAAYAADNGFTDIRFAVLSPELLGALADTFGTTVANPPATPKIVVDAMGGAGELTTGPQSADDLVGLLRSATG